VEPFKWKKQYFHNKKKITKIQKLQEYRNHLKNLANTEIPYLHIAGTGNQEIVWFDITMNNVLCIKRKKKSVFQARETHNIVQNCIT